MRRKGKKTKKAVIYPDLPPKVAFDIWGQLEVKQQMWNKMKT